MKSDTVRPEDLEWRCAPCGRELVVGPVNVAYMGHRFTADLPYCPDCKKVLIPEPVALGKMAEVEQLLEDK
ncbi:MAG: DVU_1557 family redox protein [Pseudomonadota bacterium]